MENLEFYDAVGSPCCRRVRITLKEKGLSFDTKIIDLLKGEQKQAWYLKIHPDGKVPALVHNGHAIAESNIITEYLDDVFPEQPLYPTDPWDNAQVKMWQAFELKLAKHYFSLMYQTLAGRVLRITKTFDEYMAEVRQNSEDPAFLLYLEKSYKGTTLTPLEEDYARQYLTQCLNTVENALSDNTYLVGNRFSQADISVYPRLMMFPFINVPITPAKYPNTMHWLARLNERSSFSKTKSLMDKSINPFMLKQIKWADENKNNQHLSFMQKIRFKAIKKALSVDLTKIELKLKKVSNNTHEKTNKKQAPRPLIPVKNNAPLSLLSADSNIESQIVEAALNQLKLPYSKEIIDSALLAHQSEPFKRTYGDVAPPILRHGERVISGYMVILDYLNKIEGDKTGTLFPSEPHACANIKVHLYGDAEGWHKYLQRPFDQLVVGNALQERFGSNSEDLIKDKLTANNADHAQCTYFLEAYNRILCGKREIHAAREKLASKLRKYEQTLQSQNYLLTDRTFADTALLLRLNQYEKMGIVASADAYPAIYAWRQRVLDMNKVAVTHSSQEKNPQTANAE